ncbi:MAG: CocE/NonD family hydrolase [Chloroflexi bacterium]|nr:CocE/NonD family hydrolase [Chloroflexota bacterium]
MNYEPFHTHDIDVLDPVWIPMSDGTRLAARIYVPRDAYHTPAPAVLEYLPYRRNDGTARRDALRHPYLAAHGIVAVRVDMRGSGDSDGVLYDEYLPQEQLDACEVIAWLAAQPWCNGNVGMFGISWGGFNALQVAARRPPALKAIITVCSTDDRYADDVHFMGGCLLAVDMLPWASVMLAYNSRPPDPAMVGPQWREEWLGRISESPRYSETWLSHQRRDAYWQQGSVCEDFSQITCAVYAVGGWADGYTNAVMRLLDGLSAPRKGLIGPWAHKYPEAGSPGPAIGFQAEAIRWWKYWLNGDQNGIMDGPMLTSYLQTYMTPATWYQARAGRWVADVDWPAPSVTMQRTLFTTNPAHTPVRIGTTLRSGADSGMWCSYAIPGDYPPDQRAEDGRSWCVDGPVVDQAVDLLGFPKVTLRIASDKPHALVVVRLCDVAPDGASLLISRGLLNLTHRYGHDRVTPMTPDVFDDVTITLNAVGHHLAPGHRWRVAIAPAYWPHAWPSPELATLTLDLTASALYLPMREPQVSDQYAGDFAAPAGTDSSHIVEVRPDQRARYERFDQVTQLWELHDENDHGAFRMPDGLTYDHISADRYFIREGEPLSARSVCEHRIAIGRDAWQTLVVTHSELWCDREHFYLSNRIQAFEGDVCVHDATHTSTHRRDGV